MVPIRARHSLRLSPSSAFACRPSRANVETSLRQVADQLLVIDLTGLTASAATSPRASTDKLFFRSRILAML